MIKKEFFATRDDGVNLYRTFSDDELHIRQVETGIEFSEAVDVENVAYTYEEVFPKENEELSIEEA